MGGIQYRFGATDYDEGAIAHILCHSSVLEIKMSKTADEESHLTFPVINVTRTAKEILSLATFSADDEYLVPVAEKAIKKGASEVVRCLLHANNNTYDKLQTIAKADEPS